MYFAKNFLFLASITSFTVDTLNCHTLSTVSRLQIISRAIIDGSVRNEGLEIRLYIAVMGVMISMGIEVE